MKQYIIFILVRTKKLQLCTFYTMRENNELSCIFVPTKTIFMMLSSQTASHHIGISHRDAVKDSFFNKALLPLSASLALRFSVGHSGIKISSPCLSTKSQAMTEEYEEPRRFAPYFKTRIYSKERI